jgi:hypothetical protein
LGDLMPEVVVSRQLRPRRFFIGFALVAATLVVAGFTGTFFLPVARGQFSRPPLVYVHGSLFFGWVILLIVQAQLAASRHLGWHRRLGWVGVALIPAMTASGVGVSVWATARDLRAGKGDAAASFFLGQLMDMLVFAALASLAILKRQRPDTHKRLIVMATVAILGAAIGRIPLVGRADSIVSLALVVSLAAYDLAVRRRVHAATVYGGLAVIGGGLVQAPLGATATWLSAARRIIGIVPY